MKGSAPAYVLSPSDNGGLYWDDLPSEIVCSKCGCLIGTPPHPKRVTVEKAFDFSYTHDGHILLSQVAAEALRRLASPEPRLQEVNTNRGLMFHLDTNQVVEFDTLRRPVVFENRCDICGNYLDVFHAFPVFLLPGAIVGSSAVAKTNLAAGHKERKAPSFLVGEKLKDDLSSMRLRGLAFDPVRP